MSSTQTYLGIAPLSESTLGPASAGYHTNLGSAVIPQLSYTSRGPPVGAPHAGPFPSIDVGVPVRDALEPSKLPQVLRDALDLAFEHSRGGQKFTIRLLFCIGGKFVANSRPVQMHECRAGDQSSPAVRAAWGLGHIRRSPHGGSVPLMRATVVEKVAETVRDFLGELKMKRTPLVFNGREVDHNHLRIVNIFRPTPATMQPTLDILPEFQALYLAPVPCDA